MAKFKLAQYWAASCGGCEEAVVDLNEKILDLVEAADLVFWPVALDFKYKDVEAMKDKEIDVCLFNGAIRNSEQKHIAELLRKKSKFMIAFGACACYGGIPGLGNFTNKKEIFETAYRDSPSTVNPDFITPQPKTEIAEGELTLPEFYNTVKTLDQVVEVNYYIPGCPPQPDTIWNAIEAIVKNELPPNGATLAGKKSLCDECDRKKDVMKIKKLYRPYEIEPDPEICLLEQGIICCGPATRSGCGQKCINANMPCRGCYGPSEEVSDQGAKLLSSIASMIDSNDTDKIKEILGELRDPAGLFYRFSLPASLLHRKTMKGD